MAHANAVSTHGVFREPLDGGRIAGGAGAVLINAAMVLLLLVPLSQQATRAPIEHDDAIQVFDLRKIEPVEPPPTTPVNVTTRPPTPTTRPVPTLRTQPIAPQAQQIVDTQPGDVAITTPDAVTTDTASSLEPIAPPAGAQLRAVQSPPPPYPGEALRQNLSGTVELEILVDVDGRPLDVRIVRSSGHRILDQAARRTVLSKWRFQPAMRDGAPVQALGRVPIEFKL